MAKADHRISPCKSTNQIKHSLSMQRKVEKNIQVFMANMARYLRERDYLVAWTMPAYYLHILLR